MKGRIPRVSNKEAREQALKDISAESGEGKLYSKNFLSYESAICKYLSMLYDIKNKGE